MTQQQLAEIEAQSVTLMGSIERILDEEKIEGDSFATLQAQLLFDVLNTVRDAWIHLGRIRKRIP